MPERILPPLTPHERTLFQRELTEAEKRLPEVFAQAEQFTSQPGRTEEELDDAGEGAGFALSWVQQLRDLLARAPSVESPAPNEARVHSRVLVRHDSEVWYRIVFSSAPDVFAPDIAGSKLIEEWPDGLTTTFWGTPIADALLGRHPGDRSLIKLPAGETPITILDVHPGEPPGLLLA